MSKKRHPNARRVKIHYSYTVSEAADVCDVHKNTVRQWIKEGLPVCNDQHPTLILGRELAAFLKAKRAKHKSPCKSGEMYCLKCRSPRPPADGIVDYYPSTDTVGNLVALCPKCATLMNRRASLNKLEAFHAALGITITLAQQRITDSQ